MFYFVVMKASVPSIPNIGHSYPKSDTPGNHFP